MSRAVELAPATPGDMPLIEACVRRFRLDDEHLEAAQFIVARSGGSVLGFGRIKPYGGGVFELGCVGVLEEVRAQGVGRRLVEELVRRFPARQVYITTDLPSYFERLGFRRAEHAPPEILAKIDRVCSRLRSGVVAMVREKAGDGQ